MLRTGYGLDSLKAAVWSDSRRALKFSQSSRLAPGLSASLKSLRIIRMDARTCSTSSFTWVSWLVCGVPWRAALEAMLAAHPYEEPAYHVYAALDPATL